MTPPGPTPPIDGHDGEWDDEFSDHGHDFPDHGHDDAHRGWLPPDDRLWRHPSELGGGDLGHGELDRILAGQATSPRRAWAIGLVGVGAVAAVVAGAVLMNTVGSGGGAGPGFATTSTTVVALTSASATNAEEGMVSLDVTTPEGTVLTCGVAVSRAGYIATTADAVAHATSVTATMGDGQVVPAAVVAIDPHSDLALVQVGEAMAVPRFADDGHEARGSAAMVVSLAPVSPIQGVPAWSTSTITSVGTGVETGSASGIGAIAAATPVVSGQSGGLLVAPDGSIVGLLDKQGTPASAGVEVFLPSQLVLGVSDQLASSGLVRHGWLDVDGHDAPSAPGALVVSVESGGAAASALHKGDVIEALSGAPVRSMAELRSRLYVLEPGTRVSLTLSRNGQRMVEDVELASSP